MKRRYQLDSFQYHCVFHSGTLYAKYQPVIPYFYFGDLCSFLTVVDGNKPSSEVGCMVRTVALLGLGCIWARKVAALAYIPAKWAARKLVVVAVGKLVLKHSVADMYL